MATQTQTPGEVSAEETKRRQETLKRAGISTDLSGYTEEQLQRASELADSELTGDALRKRIMGNGSGGGGGKPTSSKGNGKAAAAKSGATVKRTKPARGEKSMRQATIEVLQRARGPLHVDEISKRVLAMPEVKTNGKTPEASIAARLAVGAKRGEFKRTAPATYTLPDKAGK